MKETDKEINIDNMTLNISKQIVSQQRAEKNWQRIRKMKHRIIGLGQ